MAVMTFCLQHKKSDLDIHASISMCVLMHMNTCLVCIVFFFDKHPLMMHSKSLSDRDLPPPCGATGLGGSGAGGTGGTGGTGDVRWMMRAG